MGIVKDISYYKGILENAIATEVTVDTINQPEQIEEARGEWPKGKGWSDSVIADCEGVCPVTDIVVYTVKVKIHYTIIPESGDGWDAPHTPASAEFNYAQMHMPGNSERITDDPLHKWAEAWFEQYKQTESGIFDPPEHPGY